ncbi:12508_t:CDS:1, partial [Gigaspora margarita]
DAATLVAQPTIDTTVTNDKQRLHEITRSVQENLQDSLPPPTKKTKVDG